MLATASYPTSALQLNAEESSQYKPTKDVDSFKALFPQPVEFAEGSSTGALAIPEHKFQPLKDSITTPRKTEKTSPSTPSSISTPTKLPKFSPSLSTKSLHTSSLNYSWPETVTSAGSGLYNIGNTCFLNSTLQCLLHIPPLLRIVIAHKEQSCIARPFCMTCEMRKTIIQTYGQNTPFRPTIATKLNVIAKHMKKGRQEDSHEFLRYAIDAFQKSCLAGLPPKIDPKLAETTWVHKLFGGRLRSRVTCGKCGFNSDTMDSILDISLDICNIATLKEAFEKFVGVDYLKGGNKYKCEKCKKLVPAEKQFTIHDAPSILTVHLKRFSPLGRKIGHFVKYDQRLVLQPYMSEGQHGPAYSLFGVICHAGGGPHSGHYIAHVKDRNGRFWEMNDEVVSKSNPLDLKSAYMLFYIRENPEEEAPSPTLSQTNSTPSKKRKVREDEEVPPSSSPGGNHKSFIGPVLPSSQATPLKRQKSEPTHDPQADTLRRKIEATARLKNSLVDESYGSDEDTGSPVIARTGTVPLEDPSPNTSQRSITQASLNPQDSPSPAAIPPSSFYGASSQKKNDSSGVGRSYGVLSGAMRDRHGRPNNPFDSNRLKNNLNGVKAKKKRYQPRGL